MANADNPVKVSLLTTARKQQVVDLESRSSSTYSNSKDNVALLFDGNDQAKYDSGEVDCYDKVGVGFEFKATETLHEVVIWLEDHGASSSDKWDDIFGTRVYFGDNAGLADSAFGPLVNSVCAATNVFTSTKGIWTIRSIGTRRGKWLSIVAAAGDCKCNRRRRQLGGIDAATRDADPAGSSAHHSDWAAQSRNLKGEPKCVTSSCGKIKLTEMRAYVYACPGGTYPSSPTSISNGNCLACPKGSWCPSDVPLGTTGSSTVYRKPCPAGTQGLEAAVAEDPGAVETGFSQADVLQLSFTGDTNEPDVGARASSAHGVGVYASFVFWAVSSAGEVFCSSPDAAAREAVAASAGVGAGSVATRALLGGGVGQLSALWTTASRVRIDVVVVDSSVDTGLISLGLGRFHVFPVPGRLRAAASTAQDSATAGLGSGDTHFVGAANQVSVTGTWGVQGSAALASATLRGLGSAEGADAGDTLLLQFNQVLAGRPLAELDAGRGSGPAVVDLVPLGAAAPWTGWSGSAEWVLAPSGARVDLPPPAANSSVILVTVTAVNASDPPAGGRTFGGRLSVRVRAAAALYAPGFGASEADLATNNVTALGSWGEVPSTPLFRSHSPTSALLAWREPLRPEGQLSVAAWATLGLEGFLVRWCDAGSIVADLLPAAAFAPGDGASDSAAAVAAAASVARSAFPVRSSNASGMDQLAAAGHCAAAFVPRPASDAALLAGLRLPLLPVEPGVPVASGRALLATVSAVFDGVVGPPAAAVDATPGSLAAAALDPSDVVCLDASAHADPASAPACSPFAPGTTAARQRSCRCVAASSSSSAGAWGDVAGSAFSTPLQVRLHGVGPSAAALGTPGGEFVTLLGAGLPTPVAGMALTDDHEALLAAELRTARQALADRAGSLAFSRGLREAEVAADGVRARRAQTTPYVSARYGSRYALRDCAVTEPGLALQCLSAAGVGRLHAPNVTVNGHAPAGPVTALSAVGGRLALGVGSVAVAHVSYSAPYVQEFELPTPDSLLPTAGGVFVLLRGRHFGPAGADNIEHVTFSPARFPAVSFDAANCTVSEAHVAIRCLAPPSAGQQSYWSARIAGQDSLLPATSVRPPALAALSLVTLEQLQAAPPAGSLIRAAAAVLGIAPASNASAPLADAVLARAAARAEAIPAAASQAGGPTADSIPSAGGSLVWLQGSDLGGATGFLASVWMTGGGAAGAAVRREVFSQDVDTANQAGVPGAEQQQQQQTTTAPACVVAEPHSSILCVAPPGTGTDYAWRVQVLGADSGPAPQTTSYAPLRIVALSPAELPTEGGTVTVSATNLPPPNDPFPLVVVFNGVNITTATRDAASPLTAFRFDAPPVLLLLLPQPQPPPPLQEPSAAANGTGGQQQADDASTPSASALLVVAAASQSSSRAVPVTPPTVTSLDADSARRNEDAAQGDPSLLPPAAAGGASAVLLEVYGSSFGGQHGSLRLWVGESLCQTLTLPQIAAHLTLPTPYDPHRHFFCWTAQFSGQIRMQDGSQRITVSHLAYDYDAIKTPPAPLSAARVLNATTGDRSPATALSPRGGDLLLLDGLSMGSVTAVQLLLLADPATQGAPPSSRAVRFAAPCPVLRRADAIAAGGPDPCPTIEAPPSSPLCVSPRQVLCASTPGVGGAYFALAVAESSSKRLEGYSAAAIAGYAPPQALSLSPATLRTAGGETLTVVGSGFGLAGLPMADDPSLLRQPEVSVAGRPCALLSRNSSVLTCAAPPGIAAEAQVVVAVEGQTTAPLTVAYAAPAVDALRTFVLDPAGDSPALMPLQQQPLRLPGTVARLPTRGGWLLLAGANFGPSPVVWLRDPASLAQTQCAVRAPPLPGAWAVSPSHNQTWCFAPAGSQAALSVVLATSADAALARDSVATPAFGYDPPSVASVWFEAGTAASRALGAAATPQSASQLRLTADGLGLRPTRGGFLVHVVGSSFGLGATVTIGGARCEAVGGLVDGAAPMGLGLVTGTGAAVGGLPPVSVAPGPPGAPQPLAVLSADGEERAWSTHELASCVAPQGSGIQRLELTTAAQRVASAAFRYDPPAVLAAAPALLVAAGVSPPSRNLVLSGSNFGAIARAATAERERLINVTARRILPDPQAAPGRAAAQLPPPSPRALQAGSTFGLRVSAAAELCASLLMQAAHEELLCAARDALPVGLVLFDVTVAQQTSAPRVALSLCRDGSTGGPGETCRECPLGAFCAGGFFEPQPLPGFFKQSASVFLACNPAAACRGAESVLGRALTPFRDNALGLGALSPNAILLPQAAEPLLVQTQQPGTASAAATAADSPVAPTAAPASGLGSWSAEVVARAMDLSVAFPANGTLAQLLAQAQAEAVAVGADQCVAGYKSARCAECEERFYRLEGRCEPCPELAWLMIPGFILALLCLLGVAQYLQKKNVQLAGLSVGVDMMQILSVFAALDLNWPIEIRNVFVTVKATSFSLEFLAPECSVKVAYADKFFGVAAIPVLLVAGATGVAFLQLALAMRRRMGAAGDAAWCVSPKRQKRHTIALGASSDIAGLLQSASSSSTPSKAPKAGTSQTGTATTGARGAARSGKSPSDTSCAAVSAPVQTASSSSSRAASVALKLVLANIPTTLDTVPAATCSPLAAAGRSTDTKAVPAKAPPSQRGLRGSPPKRPLATPAGSCSPLATAGQSTDSKAVPAKAPPSQRGLRGSPPKRPLATPAGVSLPTSPKLSGSAPSAVKPSPRADPRRGEDAASTLDAVDAAIGLTLTLLFYSYLTATRNALQPLDCATVDATDGSGSWEVIRLEPAVRCSQATDPTYAAVAPWAVVTLLLYGLGIPTLFGVLLYCNRTRIVADQILLAKGEGFSQLSNPNFATRKRFGRLYADFRPEAFWWRLVLTTRKALVAAVSIMLTGNPTFAAAVTALILFVSFLLHNRYQPFLRVPAVSAEFLALAQDATAQGKPAPGGAAPVGTPAVAAGGDRQPPGWTRCPSPASCLPDVAAACLRNSFPVMAVCLSSNKPSRSKRSRMAPRIARAMSSSALSRAPSSSPMSFRNFAQQALDAKVVVEARQAAKVAVAAGLDFVFDYNTLEGSFLITGVLVLMGGLAFASNAMPVGSPAYVTIVAAVVLLVLSAIVGFTWILGFELYRALRFASTLRKARAFQERCQQMARRKRDTLSFLKHAPSNRLQALAKLAMRKPTSNPLQMLRS